MTRFVPRQAIALAALLATTVLSTPASAQLNDLIRRNVQDSYNRSVTQSAIDPQAQPAQLWVHVRNEVQRRQVQDNVDWFKGLKVQGLALEMRPVQLVSGGPQESQLRYFKRQDADDAERLARALAPAFPHLQVADMSGTYQRMEWMRPGHFELWLAPDLARISPPRR